MDAMSYESLQAIGDVAGVVSRGLAPAAIAALPLATLAQLRAHAGGDAPHACTICMGDFEEQGARRALACLQTLPAHAPIYLPYTTRAAASHGQPAPTTHMHTHHPCARAPDALKLLPCGHGYHPECVDTWLGVNKACPVCTKEVQAAAPAPAPAGVE